MKVLVGNATVQVNADRTAEEVFADLKNILNS